MTNFLLRAAALTILTAVVLLYFPVNRGVSGGTEVSSRIDDYIPLVPVFVIPYISGIVAFFAVIVWAAIRARWKTLLQFYISCCLAALVSYVIFIAFPTYVERPEVSGGGLLSRLLRWVYKLDRPYNVFPSSHTYFSVITTYFLWRWFGGGLGGVAAIVAGSMVIASTVLVKQHSVLDVGGGVALAVVCILVSAIFVVPFKEP
jgi:membrane-associated phospholipid phosphatase